MNKTILNAMAKAFFACAWADQAEETGNGGILSGNEIMDIMPNEIDPAALHAAKTLYMDMEQVNSVPLDVLFTRLCDLTEGEGDREHTEDIFGHYCAMQSMGHGVGLEDAFGTKARVITVPYVSFGSYSLEKDYFKEQDSDDE